MLAWWPHPPGGVSAPRSSDLRIFISDAYLARVVERRLSGIPVPSVDKVRIASNPPQSLIVRVGLTLGLLSAPAALELMPVARNGHVQTLLVSTEVAGIALPPQLTGFMEGAINSRIAELPGEVAGRPAYGYFRRDLRFSQTIRDEDAYGSEEGSSST